MTGTDARSVISSKLCGLRMPMPDPMGDPSGMIAAQPTSSSFRASTGSSLVYGRTVKPSSTRISAASSSSTPSGRRVRSSATTSSLIQSVPSASRASRAVRTASPAVKQPAVLGRTEMPSLVSTDRTEPWTVGSSRRIATVVSSVPDATRARSRTSRLGAPPVPMIRREVKVRPPRVKRSSAMPFSPPVPRSGSRPGRRRPRRWPATARAGPRSR